jgi:hypothetical protein
MSSTRYRSFILSVILLIISTVPASAQVTGSFAGTVRDSTGAVLPGRGHGPRSAAARSVTVPTNADGTYRIPLVPPGTYSVTTELSGFTTQVRQASASPPTSRRRSTSRWLSAG